MPSGLFLAWFRKSITLMRPSYICTSGPAVPVFVLVLIISESQPLVDSKSFYITDDKTMTVEFVFLTHWTRISLSKGV